MITIAGVKLRVVTVDFETYYENSSGYSLKNKEYNTSQYVRDPKFKAHGVGIKKGTGKTVWYTGDKIAKALRAIDWSKSALLGHNTAFDGFIMSHHFGLSPAFYLDTMSMAKAVHGGHHPASLDYLARLHGLAGKTKAGALLKTMGILNLPKEMLTQLGEYCKDDCDDTRALFDILYPYVPDKELQLINLSMRMFCQPKLLLDVERVEKELAREIAEKQAAIDYVLSICTVKDLQSNDKFAQLLLDQGFEPPKKVSPRTGLLTYAFAKTDLDFVDMQENGPPIVQALCTARVRNKTTTNETRARRFLEAGKNGWRIPVLLNYCGAHTFRWSGGNKMNLQNLMRGGELRRSLLAPKGHVIVVADSAQIEARTLAWLAGEKAIVSAFANKQDVYKMMASAIYHVPVDEVTSEQRFVGKVSVLGLGYGMGATKFRDTLAKGAMGPKVFLSAEEAQRVVTTYRLANRKIVELWSRAEAILIDMVLGREGSYGPISWGKEFIRMPNGLFMHYRELTGSIYTQKSGKVRISDATYKGKNGVKTYIYGGLLVENIVQCLARCIVADQMLEIDPHHPIVTMSHDEIVSLAKKAQAKAALKKMISIMSVAPDWAEGLPLSAEGGYDVCYSK